MKTNNELRDKQRYIEYNTNVIENIMVRRADR